MDDATRLFIEVWNRLTLDWSRILTFHQMGTIGQDSARDAIHRSNLYFVQHSLLHGEYRKLLKDPESFVRDGLADRVPRSMTEAAVTTYRQTLDAASLVFAHSILDAAMFDCLRICALSAPKDWLAVLGEKKVGIAVVAAKPFTDLLGEAIDAELTRLERLSLLTKIDRLFQHCQPKKQVYLTNGFRFDRDRLLALDNMRHEIVHAPGKPQAFESLHQDLEFMRSCGTHIFVMLHERFDLVFSGREVAEVLSDRYRSPPNES
jgi:hypothetical protein